MIEKIIIAGSGGQGIMLLGKVLAEAAMRENKCVTWLPAYGAEVRGGTAYCMVIISDSGIGSPYVGEADTLISMNQPSWEKFKSRLHRRGLAICNSDKPGKHNFTLIASSLGDVRVANMVALGSYVAARKTVKAETVFAVMRDFAPKGDKRLFEINKEAVFKGMGLKHG